MYTKQKTIKRFTYGVNFDSDSHQAGSNRVTITTNPVSGQYSTGTAALAMSVKEAQVLRTFLNEELSNYGV